MRVQGGVDFIKALYRRYLEDEITALSAQMTYYLILSFFPFLIFLITLVTYTPLVSDQALYSLSALLPSEVYNLILEVVYGRSLTILSFGMVTALWAASNGMSAIMKGISKAYNQKQHRSFFWHRLVSILFTVGFILVLVTTLGLLVLGHSFAGYIFEVLGISSYFLQFWTLIRYSLSLGVMWAIFSVLYCFAPQKPFSLRYVWPGSTFAVFGWITISLGFSYYVEHFSRYTYTYGSIGAVIILLIWLYISSIIILLGAEINGLLLPKNN